MQTHPYNYLLLSVKCYFILSMPKSSVICGPVLYSCVRTSFHLLHRGLLQFSHQAGYLTGGCAVSSEESGRSMDATSLPLTCLKNKKGSWQDHHPPLPLFQVLASARRNTGLSGPTHQDTALQCYSFFR